MWTEKESPFYIPDEAGPGDFKRPITVITPPINLDLFHESQGRIFRALNRYKAVNQMNRRAAAAVTKSAAASLKTQDEQNKKPQKKLMAAERV